LIRSIDNEPHSLNLRGFFVNICGYANKL